MVIFGYLRLAHGGESGCGSERLRYQFLACGNKWQSETVQVGEF